MNGTLFHGDLVCSKRILYTPSMFAKNTLAYLQEIGELTARQPHVNSRGNLSSYLFIAVLAGSGTLEYLGKRHALGAGDCVFIDCKPGYAHATSKDLWTLQWIHFSGPCMQGIYQKYVERGGFPVFHPEAQDSFHTIWKRLYEAATSADYIRDMRINEYLTHLLTLLMEQSWHPDAQTPADQKQRLWQVRMYLEQHYPDHLTLDDLAARFYMSKYYLSHTFKEQFGMTVWEYLQAQRITQAKELLRFTDQTTQAIAAACGLNDANYFSRVFRKVEGMSPSAYRRAWKS